MRRFIPALVDIIRPLHHLTQKNIKYKWGVEHQRAFEAIKDILAHAHTLVAPLTDKELLIYLIASEEAMGVLIAQELDGQEKPVYYLSKLLKGPELEYSDNDKLYVALIYTVTKLRHYMITYRIKGHDSVGFDQVVASETCSDREICQVDAVA